MLSVDKIHCTGCGSCVQRCPQNCISFVEDGLGCTIPQIDQTGCINCGACEQVCPIDRPIEANPKQTFWAAVNKDKRILKRSTSGGFFSALAQKILMHNGVVYGCTLTSDFRAKHIRISDENHLDMLRGSKYVQSDTGNTFREARADLEAGDLCYTPGPHAR